MFAPSMEDFYLKALGVESFKELRGSTPGESG